jgi:hypothetical protein
MAFADDTIPGEPIIAMQSQSEPFFANRIGWLSPPHLRQAQTTNNKPNTQKQTKQTKQNKTTNSHIGYYFFFFVVVVVSLVWLVGLVGCNYFLVVLL